MLSSDIKNEELITPQFVINYKKRTREPSPDNPNVFAATKTKKSLHINTKVCFLSNKDRDSKGNRKLLPVTTFNRQSQILKRAIEIEDHLLLDKIHGRGDTCIDMIAYELMGEITET